jgi:uncharacterized membrane protein
MLTLRRGVGDVVAALIKLIVIGLLLTATGLLWMGQGAGYIMWPQSSFMLLQTQWVYYGALTVTLGVAFVLAGLFKRR